MDDTKATFMEHYKKEARRYDERRYGCLCGRMYSDIQLEMAVGFLQSAERILDAGCGTGRFAIHLAKSGKDVVGVDASNEMLTVAKEKAQHEGVNKRVDFRQGDIEAIPFPDESFDGVVSIAVLRHFESLEKGLAEMARVLKPGGTLVTDFLDKKYFIPRDFIVGRPKGLSADHFFRNYYRTLREIRQLMNAAGVRTIGSRSILKFPSHIILCRMGLKGLEVPLKWLEKHLNCGGVTMVCGRKQHAD